MGGDVHSLQVCVWLSFVNVGIHKKYFFIGYLCAKIKMSCKDISLYEKLENKQVMLM